MSRKAKAPVVLPKGVEAKVVEGSLSVRGPKGTLTCPLMEGIEIIVKEGHVTLASHPNLEDASKFLGLYWSLIANMAQGVTQGFTKSLEMVGVGYRAAVQGGKLDIQIGTSHPILMSIPKGIEVSVEKNTLISIKGIDKQLVGQFAANVRAKRPPEPYKGKGIRYVNEYVRRKAGKTGKK